MGDNRSKRFSRSERERNSDRKCRFPRERRAILRRINAVVGPEEAHAEANTKILDQGWKPSDPGIASGVSEADIRAPDERELNPVDRNTVIALHEQKVIAAEREKIYRREGSGAAEVGEPLSRSGGARAAAYYGVSLERECLRAESRKRNPSIERSLGKRVSRLWLETVAPNG